MLAVPLLECRVLAALRLQDTPDVVELSLTLKRSAKQHFSHLRPLSTFWEV